MKISIKQSQDFTNLQWFPLFNLTSGTTKSTTKNVSIYSLYLFVQCFKSVSVLVILQSYVPTVNPQRAKPEYQS